MTPWHFFGQKGNLAGLQAGNEQAPSVLMLHGWLDNAASFSRLAPQLLHKNAQAFHIVAPDLPGHGQSDWLAAGAEYLIWSYLPPLSEWLEQQVEPIHLVGHSLGGAVALLLAGCFPDKIRSLVLLDSVGPLTCEAAQLPELLAQALRSDAPKPMRQFEYIAQAIDARLRVNPALSTEGIFPVVERNIKVSGQRLQWRTDPRLRAQSSVRLTEEQVAAFLQRLQCPCLVLLAQQGIIPESMVNKRLAYVSQARVQYCEGHHHFHLEPQSFMKVAEAVEEFLYEC